MAKRIMLMITSTITLTTTDLSLVTITSIGLFFVAVVVELGESSHTSDNLYTKQDIYVIRNRRSIDYKIVFIKLDLSFLNENVRSVIVNSEEIKSLVIDRSSNVTSTSISAAHSVEPT